MNPYDVLQVSTTADALVIRAAYRSLIQRNHPDRNPGDVQAAQRAVLVTQAYELLVDAERRAAYDKQFQDDHDALRDAPISRSKIASRPQPDSPQLKKAAYPKSLHFGLTQLAIIALVVVCLGWTVGHFSLADPQRKAPEKQLADIRLQVENPQTSEAQRQVLLARKLTVLELHEGLQKAESAMRAEDMAARSLTLLPEPITVSLLMPAGLNVSLLQLSIPEITLVLGSFDTLKLREHLLKHRPRLVQELAQKLAAQAAGIVLAPESEARLRRLIGESVMESLDIRPGEAFASTYFESPGRYGVVGVVLPQNFIVLK